MARPASTLTPGIDRRRQHCLAVLDGLRIEQLPRRHRHDTAPDVLARELEVRVERKRQLRTGRDEDEIRRPLTGVDEDVRALWGMSEGRSVSRVRRAGRKKFPSRISRHLMGHPVISTCKTRGGESHPVVRESTRRRAWWSSPGP
jgi:hypothetical protein